MRVAVVVAVTAVLALGSARTAESSAGTDDGSAGVAARTRCLTACDLGYARCIQRDEAKRPGLCGTADARCRDACPPTRERAADVGAPPAAALAPAAAPAVPTAAAPADSATAPPAAPAAVAPSLALRAAPAPVAEPAAAPRDPRAERIIALQPETQVASEESAPAHADASAESAPRPRRRRNLWRSVWCMVRTCPPESVGPRTCREICSDAHDECTAREDPKRPGRCATELMRCNQRCDTPPAGRR